MSAIRNISAVIFDMDGTLIDSEPYTARAVHQFCQACRVDPEQVDCSGLDGLSWEAIGQRISTQVPALAEQKNLAERLHTEFHHLLLKHPPPMIKGAKAALIAASKLMPVAVVSSSLRESVQATVRQLDVEHRLEFFAGAEDTQIAKPAPDAYLNAAGRFGVAAAQCLVFEDSLTGVRAAHRAGMQVVAITSGQLKNVEYLSLTHLCIKDYSELEENFFDHIKKPASCE